VRGRGGDGRGEPDRWARGRQRSLTGGPADAQGPLATTTEGGNGCGLASQWTGLDGAVVLGQRRGNGPRSLFHFDFPTGVKQIRRKYLGISENYEILKGGRFEYLTLLLYWAV
jgi:hypothetical protein